MFVFMRRLGFLGFLCLLLISCNQSRTHLNKAEALFGVHYDSMQYHLLQIDRNALSPSEENSYHYLRMSTSADYLMSFSTQELDSIMKSLKKDYPKGHPRAFHTRMLEVFYHYQKQERPIKADSLTNLLKAYTLTPNDSVRWYLYKQQIKTSLYENDSAIHFLKKAEKHKTYPLHDLYRQMGFIYHAMDRPDSALYYHMKSIETAEGRELFSYSNLFLELLAKEKNYPKAWEYLKRLRERMKRKDIPYLNLLQGDMWMEMQRPDSAMKHYRIATESGNSYIAFQAYERIGKLLSPKKNTAPAFYAYVKAMQVENSLYSDLHLQEQKAEFEHLKLQNQLNKLEVERQKHVILILGLILFVVILTGLFGSYLFYRKRKQERRSLIQENLLLKQQEELTSLREKEAILREKDALMREELFKRMKVAEKLPLSKSNHTFEEGKHIHLSETDWAEIRLMLDSSYPSFIQTLKSTCPTLTDKDINFCCLIKINLNLQNLADIYCISINSVSRRKLRLKEKLSLSKDESLSQYLKRLDGIS